MGEDAQAELDSVLRQLHTGDTVTATYYYDRQYDVFTRPVIKMDTLRRTLLVGQRVIILTISTLSSGRDFARISASEKRAASSGTELFKRGLGCFLQQANGSFRREAGMTHFRRVCTTLHCLPLMWGYVILAFAFGKRQAAVDKTPTWCYNSYKSKN